MKKEIVNIDLDGRDLWITVGIIIGGFTGNWQPLGYIIIVSIIMGVLKVKNEDRYSSD